jgi:TnpA family transposase
LPLGRIATLLSPVDAWCDLTRGFRRPNDRAARIPDFCTTLLAPLIAPGTNLGIATMAHSVAGITVDMLQDRSQGCLREETLHAATTLLVNSHHQLPLSAVWGDGTVSSSDGQRFGLPAHAFLGSLSPRYFGSYDKALTVSTYTSDQHRVWHTPVMACSVREALDVLDGLRNNATILRPTAHVVDQHGFPAHLFGLCHLLGFSWMPRLPVRKQTLSKWDRTQSYGALDDVIPGTIDTELMRAQGAPLVRVVASLRNRTAPAHVVLRRLARSAPSDRLAKARTALGRALRRLYLCRSIQEAGLRARMHLQRNRGEGRPQVARRLFCAKQGAFQTGDDAEIMHKATCLRVLSNAAVLWNTV